MSETDITDSAGRKLAYAMLRGRIDMAYRDSGTDDVQKRALLAVVDMLEAENAMLRKRLTAVEALARRAN